VQDRALEIAVQLAAGAQPALRWTKQTLNNWYRAQSGIFDASLAYEFFGFGGPDAREGLASHTEKREPNFRTDG
jgi:enoyl-CoA hydratase